MHFLNTYNDDTENQNSQPNARHEIQFLLCDTGDNPNEGPSTIQRSPQTDKRPAKKTKRSTAATPATTLSVIPDKDRKRPYRLSSKQRQRRLDNEALESRTFNLSLDVNNLK
ncbi:hypothetical protein ON010_g15607 [Phytophthora cinnamomi]|nr:hypothetical protein ON010_g15607 [Phytophthora cinnamomi]